MTVDGFLVIAKPPGGTSMDVVRAVKRLTREKKVGHGGTLDPIAEGVLPICLGQATRLMESLVDGTKRYTARLRLGVTTDTYDSTGNAVKTADPSGVTREAVESALGQFRGVIAQVPPRFSALKQGGERLYDLARAGITVEPEARTVKVFSMELRGWSPPELELDTECGRGFYVRSLAHDLGEALGCGGHLVQLTRMRTGPFALDDAVTLEQLAEAVEAGTWRDLLHPMDSVVSGLKAAVIDKVSEAQIMQGRSLILGRRTGPPTEHGERCRLYSVDGRFLALARFDRPLGQWRPEKVFGADSGSRKERAGSFRRPPRRPQGRRPA